MTKFKYPPFSIHPERLKALVSEAKAHGSRAQQLVDALAYAEEQQQAEAAFERVRDRICEVMESEGFYKCNIRVQLDAAGALMIVAVGDPKDRIQGTC